MNRECGSALIFVMLVVIVLGMITSLAFERNRVLERDRVSAAAERKAFHAADGGIEWVRHVLATDPEFTNGSVEIGTCRVEVKVSPIGADSWRVVSSATLYPRGEKGLPHICVETVELVRDKKSIRRR